MAKHNIFALHAQILCTMMQKVRERQALQTAIDRQIDRYTELKSMVVHLKPMSPPDLSVRLPS
jgi:hypothetical protein